MEVVNDQRSTTDQLRDADDYAPLTVAEAMDQWRPGSQDWTWADESRDLWDRDRQKMAALVSSIRWSGLREPEDDEEPICLGNDGRVWEGHHRLVAAASVNERLLLPRGVVFGFSREEER